MEKEDLGNVILETNEFLNNCLEQLNNDISYNEDLIEIDKKHNKVIEINKKEKTIEELKVRRDTIQSIIDEFTDNLSNNDIDLDELKEYCER